MLDFFGINPTQYTLNGQDAIKEVQEIFLEVRKFNGSKGRILFGDLPFRCTRRYRKTMQKIASFRKFFEEKIEERMKAIEHDPQHVARKDVLEIIAEDRRKYKNDPSKTFSNDELIDEFGIFFIAGKDTTSILITMALY